MDEFERIRVIGKGSYGEVWLSKHKKDQKQYVLKKINLQRATRKERSAAEQEANLLQKLKHPNIVSYKSSFETSNGMLYIAMQFCEHGDLYTKLKEQKSVLLQERQVVEWFVQITMALQYLHERNILHRDLKTQNIFLTRSKIIKLGDLGIARVLDAATDMATTLIGTPYYMSPEIFSNKPYNHKSDVWALGCCLYEMTTLKHAFNAKDMNSLVYKILKGKLPPMPHQYSPELLDLLRAMLHQDPIKRPTINRILRDPYIRRNIAIFLEDTRRGANRRVGAAGPRPSTPSSAGRGRPSSSASSAKSAAAPNPRPPAKDDGARLPRPSSATPGRERKPSVQTPKNIAPSAGRGDGSSSRGRKESESEAGDDDTIKDGEAKGNKEVDSRARSEGERSERRRPASSGLPAGSQPGREDTPQIDRASASNKGTPPVPVPKADRSEGVPQRHVSQAGHRKISASSPTSPTSKSSSLSDSVTDDTPMSQPKLSAREKRRQENARLNEQPLSARSMPRLRKVPETPAKASKQRQRQPSIQDSSSSSDDTLVMQDENTKERQKRRDNKEMDMFITMLDMTLKKNVEGSQSDDEDTSVAAAVEKRPASPAKPGKVEQQPSPAEPSPIESSPQRGNSKAVVSKPPVQAVSKQPADKPSSEQEKLAPIVHKSPKMPSVETLTSTSRLLDRIGLLHKDCVQGVGFPDLKKAYEILDHIEEDEVEHKDCISLVIPISLMKCPSLWTFLAKQSLTSTLGRSGSLSFVRKLS